MILSSLERAFILTYTFQTLVEAVEVCIVSNMRIEQIVLCVLCSMFLY
jgi:hypothetical protein